MGGSQNDVARRWHLLDNGRHRPDRQFVAFAGAKQTKAQDRRSSSQAYGWLDQLRVHEGQIRHAVRNDFHLPRIDAVPERKPIRRGLREDHDPGGQVSDSPQDPVLTIARIGQNGVKRGHHGDLELSQEIENPLAVIAPVDPVFVLERHDVMGGAIEPVGDRVVVARLIGPQPEFDLRRKSPLLPVERDDFHPGSSWSRAGGLPRQAIWTWLHADCVGQIAGERGDSAPARRVRSDEGHPEPGAGQGLIKYWE